MTLAKKKHRSENSGASCLFRYRDIDIALSAQQDNMVFAVIAAFDFDADRYIPEILLGKKCAEKEHRERHIICRTHFL